MVMVMGREQLRKRPPGTVQWRDEACSDECCRCCSKASSLRKDESIIEGLGCSVWACTEKSRKCCSKASLLQKVRSRSSQYGACAGESRRCCCRGFAGMVGIYGAGGDDYHYLDALLAPLKAESG